MALTTPPRPYTSEDAHKLENLARLVDKFMTKQGLTTTDVLAGLRYNGGAFESWESAVAVAVESCVMYDRYFEIDSQETERRYGKDNT